MLPIERDVRIHYISSITMDSRWYTRIYFFFFLQTLLNYCMSKNIIFHIEIHTRLCYTCIPPKHVGQHLRRIVEKYEYNIIIFYKEVRYVLLTF